MTTDLCSDDVVVCITAPQILMSDSIVSSGAGAGAGAGGSRVTSTATVELGRRLLLAARAGDTPLVLDLMARGAPFTTDWLGTSPLHLAASNAHAETCGVLLRAGFSRDARTKVRRTPLHLAAYGGHAAVAALLLEAGAAVDCRDMLRMTPLHWAAQRGHAAAAAELLRRGADPHALSKFHKSPLSIAAELRRKDLLDLIEDELREREAARSVDALVDEQMADAPVVEPQLQIFDTVQRIEQVKPKQIERKTKVDIPHSDSGNLKRDDLIKLIEDAMKDRGTKSADTEYTIVNEIEDTSTVTPQLQAFDTIHRIQEVKLNKSKQERNTKMDTQVEGSVSDGPGAALLRSHGITLLPNDDGSTVLSALQSGRTIVLSDAGKLMLKENSEPAGAGKAGPGQGKGVVLTATPVKSPPKPGVKIFTLNNKLLAVPKEANKIPVKKIINPQDMQVKFVHLPPDAKIISPSKLVPMKSKTKLARSAISSPTGAARPAVKIIMNKTNFNKLMANTTKANIVHNGIEARRTSTTTESAQIISSSGQADAEPEQLLSSTSPRYLRAQLVAAQRALAACRATLAARSAQLAACRARLALYEPV